MTPERWVIKFVQTNKENLTLSTKEDIGNKESTESDYDEDKDQIEEKQEEETGEPNKQDTTNLVFWIIWIAGDIIIHPKFSMFSSTT